ncbi:divergent polysaccharide deacetylase family protein [candidate division KSB1 bacterium]|nr:divergent polysaccharide deacetylase family protein [candidate division KSB1 bacterium]NIR73126.1 divergent polysaccharide deacetylase family protein [candidate division KSB1 bacterium]NIS27861.1 divergent polysaccharide deacetylase family protein [candidate division KSB1 bacterium]NIT74744.1 divergent polysaccharide deacetylase family protein [candidate division KSB1 bacterium]NIU28526.1 divergent polysaccharide deacetylase family protein [candidate division KSB1 bacterium]
MVPRWKVRLLGTLLVSVLILGTVKFLSQRDLDLKFFAQASEPKPCSKKEALRLSVYQVLFEYGIQVDWISGDSLSKTVRIPKDLAIVEPYTALVGRFKEEGGQLLRADSNPEGDVAVIEVGVQNEPLFALTLRKDSELNRVAGSIALIVRELHRANDALLEEFMSLDAQIGLAAFPGLNHTREVTSMAAESQHEVVVQIPFETTNGKVGDEYRLESNMTVKEIRKRVRRGIASVQGVVSVYIHIGGEANLDGALLEAILDETGKAELSLLVEREGPPDDCTLARKKGVACGVVHTFLDTIKEAPFIRQQLLHLAELASREGRAIGVCSAEDLTLRVLKNELPKLHKKGFKFVKLSEVVN